MSRYFSPRFAALEPYTPGEQPQSLERYVKLNTNECPFPPSEKARAYAEAHTRPLNLYPDPDCRALRVKLAETLEIAPEELMLCNGSDEALAFAFLAFCDGKTAAAFPEITYGFYPVFAALCSVEYQEVPLRADFSVAPEDYFGLGRTIFIANPNAPTGKLLSVAEIETILQRNPDNVVVIDEAYIDFGGTSCIPLIRSYENLLVTQTFSKSRAMAGELLGFAVGCPAQIADLNAIRCSFNPYNVNSLTTAAAMGTLLDPDYTRRCCEMVMENRTYTAAELKRRGFHVLESAANFLFAAAPDYDGGALYRALKEKGVLVRHFDKPAIAQYNRISIGTREQMDALLRALDEILQEAGQG